MATFRHTPPERAMKSQSPWRTSARTLPALCSTTWPRYSWRNPPWILFTCLSLFFVFVPKLKAADLSRSEASEEDKLRAMMAQSSQTYDPSKYVHPAHLLIEKKNSFQMFPMSTFRYQKIRGQGQVGPVPGNYCCFKCGMPGHWIKQCPLNLVRLARLVS